VEDLIEALQIFLKYGNPKHPTHCEHDVMTIVGINPQDVSETDKQRLDELGFFASEDDDYGDEANFQSFKFGSA
jgi:hypothetical protein